MARLNIERVNMRQFRRRQIKRIVVVSLISLVAYTMAFAQLYNNFDDVWNTDELALYLTPELLSEVSARLPSWRSALFKWLILALGINLVILVAAVVFITYRLAIPLYLVNKTIRAIGEGKLYTQLELEENDEFKPIAGSLNQMCAKIQLMILVIDQGLRTITEIQTEGEDEGQLQAAVDECREAIEYFETVTIPKQQI